MKKCPKCKSTKTEVVTISKTNFLKCNKCGFDESEDLLEIYPEARSTQSGKTKFSPYKTGGGKRSQKI